MSRLRGDRALADLWRYRELWRSLTVRNLRVKYQRSALGFLWTLLNPVLTVAVLAVVFTHVVKIALPHYLAFLLSAYFVWNFMMQVISSGTYLLAEQASLVRSIAFPKAIPVLAGVSSRLVEFMVEMGLILTLIVCFHHRGVPAALLLLPWLLVVQTAMALGFVLPIAALSVFYRDIQHVLPIVLTTLFYVSPVFYPASMVPEQVRTLYLVNPLAQLLTAYQLVVYEGRLPGAGLIAALSLSAGLIVAVGSLVFRRLQADVAEVI